MRWIGKRKDYRCGEARTVHRFLWWPTCPDGREWRWLERATILQIWVCGQADYGAHWQDLRFVE